MVIQPSSRSRSRVRSAAALLAFAIPLGWISPAQAQSSEDLARELTAMRAQMEQMAQRIDTLQAQLDAAQPDPETVAVQAGAGAASAAPASGAAAKDGADPTTIAWKGAPELSTSSGWSFKPRGRLQYDVGFTDSPDSAGPADGFGSEARRLRLGVEGDIPGGFGYKFEVDFAGNEVEVSDAILTYADKGFTVSIGQHNPFQSLEELTSSRFSSFIERAAFTDAFGFERRVGASVQYGRGAILVQGGLFTDNMEVLPNTSWSADGRVVFMPRVGGAQLHLGGSLHYTDLNTSTDVVRYRQRPLVHFSQERFISTGQFSAESELGMGLEAAAIAGRFHAAGEGFWQKVSRPDGLADPTFFGGYAEAGLFLTGDSRGYKKGVFDRVKPARPVGKGGIGAIEVNLRYDYLDLSDAGIVGGTQNGYGVSLVWTPIDYIRFLANFMRLEYDDAFFPVASGSRNYAVDAVGLRAQVDF